MNDRNDAAEALARAIDGEREQEPAQSAETEDQRERASEAVASDEAGTGEGEAAMPDDGGDAKATEGDPSAAGPYAESSAAASRRRGGGGRSRRTSAPTAVARFTVKACLVLGMLLVLPGLWAVGLLANLPVPMAGRANADAVAYLMLLCWPIAAILVGGALFYAKQHARQSK